MGEPGVVLCRNSSSSGGPRECSLRRRNRLFCDGLEISGSGGMADFGAFKEDDPETREIHGVP